jgi:hypothetical protein
MMPADARLTEALAAGTLEKLEKAPAEIDLILDTYRQARSSVVENGKSWDSVVKQIELLAFFASALGRDTLVKSLVQIAEKLRPDSGGNRPARKQKAAKQAAGVGKPKPARTPSKKPRGGVGSP